jgi:hypothetical protein
MKSTNARTSKRRNKMVKYIDEWNIPDEYKAEVKKELLFWKELFFNNADKQEGNVLRCDFKNNDIFFYTDCRDILSDTTLTKAEMELKERTRKRNVFMQLFLNELITGEAINKKGECSHCGSKETTMLSLGLAGTCRFCKDCNRTTIDTYVPSINNAVKILKDILIKNNVDMTFEK